MLLLRHALVSRLTATLSCLGYRLACQQTFPGSALMQLVCVPCAPLHCIPRAPFCNMITTPVFMLVPLMSIGFGYHPVTISYQYVLAATLYFLLTFAIQFYVRSLRHLKASWYVESGAARSAHLSVPAQGSAPPSDGGQSGVGAGIHSWKSRCCCLFDSRN